MLEPVRRYTPLAHARAGALLHALSMLTRYAPSHAPPPPPHIHPPTSPLPPPQGDDSLRHLLRAIVPAGPPLTAARARRGGPRPDLAQTQPNPDTLTPTPTSNPKPGGLRPDLAQAAAAHRACRAQPRPQGGHQRVPSRAPVGVPVHAVTRDALFLRLQRAVAASSYMYTCE